MNKKVEKCLEVLREIANDDSIPSNVENPVKKAINRLEENKEDLNIRVNVAIQFLKEATRKSDISIHSRTKIWNAISELEGVNQTLREEP